MYVPDAIQSKGYTLVELLIIIGIIGILVSFGLNAFARAAERQTIQAAKELILSEMQKAQKAAYVGDKDCDGALLGIEVTFTSSAVRTRARCSGGNGTQVTTTVPNVTITTSPTITFRPLDEGVTFSSGSAANIDYDIGGESYRIRIERPGTIQYMGEI